MRVKAAFFLSYLGVFPLLFFGQENMFRDFTEKIALTEQQYQAKKLRMPKGYIGENYDLKYHRFNWDIDPAVNSISGAVTSYFVTTKNSVDTISFELITSLTVDSVRFHGNLASFTHTVTDEVKISLGTFLNNNTLDSITVFYHGVPNLSGFGSFSQSFHDGGTVPIISTLSEPYGAKDWWPCKNNLSDKIDSIDVFVTTPSQYEVASNGVLVSKTTQGLNRVHHWKHRYPIASYLIAIAVTNYAIFSDWVPMGNDSLEVLNYVYPEDLSGAQVQTPALIPVMQTYNTLFMPYPFKEEKYGHAQFGWGGGMEHQTMSFMGGFGFDLMAHELAHMWFGDYITCGSWHDIWVNEGYATYLNGLAYEHLGYSYYWDFFKADKINHIVSAPGGSVYCYDTTSVSRVFDGRLSYSKGAMVLHMLRWILGDSTWYAGVKSYLQDTALAYGYAKTGDVKRHFELVSGKNLTEFFNDWIYGEGHPIYSIQTTPTGNNSYQVSINQTPSHPSVSFFEMPVPLLFKGQGQDTLIVFKNTFSGELFNVNLFFTPDSVIFDPEKWLVAKVNDVNIVTGLLKADKLSLNIYPNPLRDLINIECNQTMQAVEIFDLVGQLVYSEKYTHWFDRTEIDMSFATPGVYFIRIQTNKGTTTRKLVKQ